MPQVYDAVNTMQATPFKINKFILAVMQEAWDKGLAVGGMPPNTNLDIPNKPHDIETNKDSRREWKKKAVMAHTENARMFQKTIVC